jgi:hypothetical protein
MANKSARDKCFEEAANAYNRLVPDDHKINIEHQKPWTIDAETGKWRPASATERLWNFIKGGDPFRVPDWTFYVDGKPVAGDNKFQGDKFQARISKRTGKTQEADMNKMNEDIHPDKKEYQGMSLDPKKCGCDDPKQDPQPQDVYEYHGAYYTPHPGVGGRVLPGEMPTTEPIGPRWIPVSPPLVPGEVPLAPVRPLLPIE